MPAKKNTKTTQAPSQNNTSFIRRWARWCFFTSLKLGLALTLTLGIYAIYLDGKVRQTFEGQKWQIPVQVYGKTEIIEAEQTLDLAQLKQRLLLKGYQKVFHVDEPGEFAMSANRAIIYRRSFDFGDNFLSAEKITLDIINGSVDAIYHQNQAVKSTSLEPMLIDRILPESKEDRVFVGLEDVPEQLIDALLLVEDRDYYFHHGIAPLGILRALIANLKAGRTVQGGSTLTQQLVKNMFLTRHKTIWRKVNEAIMSLILEYRYSKDQLLEAYLNEVYLGQHYANGIYGFGLAAQFYFGEPIDELSIEQIATLVGQIKGPSYYDPWRFPERASERRDLVLGLMFEHELLSKNQYTTAITTKLSIRKTRRINKQKQPAYLQLVKRELREMLPIQLQQSGIRVFTGFDVLAQQQVNTTIKSQIPALEKAYKESDIEVAMIVTDHRNGEIRALTGGRDQHYAGFNRALNANRQIGSLVKPAVYLSALERFEQYNLATQLEDQPLKIEETNGVSWQPKNYSGKFSGQTTLFNALVKSLNVPTVNLGLALGLPAVADMLHQLGYKEDILMQPSMLLGALNMSPYQINQLFLPIAAKGVWRESHAINKVVAGSGEVIWQYEQQDAQVLSAQASYLMTHSLKAVTTTGTAKSLTWLLKDKVVAGKTGTSNDLRDSWFIGYDNENLVTTWLGKDNNKSTKFTGSSGALRLFASYFKGRPAKNIDDAKPIGIDDMWFDNKTGQAYQGRCAHSTLYPSHRLPLSLQKPCEDKHEEDKNWFELLFNE